MKFQTVRLSELKRSIPAASKKALTARLRFLEAAGVIVRKDLSKTVQHVEYELSHTMREPLVALLDHLSEWSKLYDATGQSAMQLSATEAE